MTARFWFAEKKKMLVWWKNLISNAKEKKTLMKYIKVGELFDF